MKVLLVEPVYDHPFPHLFTLKAITYWRSQGADVSWTRGNAVEVDPDQAIDLVQITTPIFSWAVKDSALQIHYLARRLRHARQIEVGGVMASLHAGWYEKATGIRPHVGVDERVLDSRPAWEEFPRERVCRVQITTGCSVGCGFCLVPKLYGVRSRRVDGWQSHFVDRDVWHVIDDNISQAMLSLPRLADELLEFFGRPGGHAFDLNSGIEPRSFTDRVADVLTSLPVHPWRTALDETSEAPYTLRAIEMMQQRGVDPSEQHVYLLYGWKDDLADALHRLDLLLDAGVAAFAMRYVPLDWFGGKLEYRPPHWDPRHYIDFARYVNQMKRRGLETVRRDRGRWSFRWFVENCGSHDHRDDPLLRGGLGG